MNLWMSVDFKVSNLRRTHWLRGSCVWSAFEKVPGEGGLSRKETDRIYQFVGYLWKQRCLGLYPKWFCCSRSLNGLAIIPIVKNIECATLSEIILASASSVWRFAFLRQHCKSRKFVMNACVSLMLFRGLSDFAKELWFFEPVGFVEATWVVTFLCVEYDEEEGRFNSCYHPVHKSKDGHEIFWADPLEGLC